MPIDAGKIVLLVVILAGFFGLMYMLKTNLIKAVHLEKYMMIS